MNVTYGLIEETYAVDSSVCKAYGIAAYEDTSKNGTATIIASIHDITTNKAALYGAYIKNAAVISSYFLCHYHLNSNYSFSCYNYCIHTFLPTCNMNTFAVKT